MCVRVCLSSHPTHFAFPVDAAAAKKVGDKRWCSQEGARRENQSLPHSPRWAVRRGQRKEVQGSNEAEGAWSGGGGHGSSGSGLGTR